jgi:hypothetical protein
MSNISRISKKAIFGILTTFILYAINALAASLPPDPDNAALLYYQAILLQPWPNFALFYKVTGGADPNEQVRKYLNVPDNKSTIELARAATQLPKCDWGLLYSGGYGLSTRVIVRLSSLCLLWDVYARTLAADGEYRAAFDQCLGMRRLATQIGDDTFLMLSQSQKVDRLALICIQHILGAMPPDAETLTWLKGQLATVQGTPWWFERAMEVHRDMELQYWRSHPNDQSFMSFKRVRESFLEEIEDDSARQEILSLTDEKLLARTRESYNKFLESSLKIVGSDMSYEDKHTELLKMTSPRLFMDRYRSGDPIALLDVCARRVESYYKLMVSNIANFNSLITAIEIYLLKAKTGQLPEKLPDGLPKDPYSGLDFEYETTKEGFVLRCRVKAIDKNKVTQYEFKVQ